MEKKNILVSNIEIEEIKKDRSKFEIIYFRFLKKIYTFTYYLTRSKQDAEDATSETFIKALKHFNKFSGDETSLSAWLYSIARTCAYDLLNKKPRNVTLDEEMIENISDNTQFVNNEAKDIFEEVLNLDDKSREVIILNYKFGYSLKEISQIIGESYENTRQIISRAIKKLRTKLK